MNDALFPLSGETPKQDDQTTEIAIRQSQVEQIRSEFQRIGLLDQDDRKRYIEEVARRPVDALRDLSALEARRIIDALRTRAPEGSKTDSKSLWDSREQNTWIDRM